MAARHAHDNVNVDVAFLGDTRDCEICSPALNVYCAFIDDGSDGVVSKFLDQVVRKVLRTFPTRDLFIESKRQY